MSESANVLRAHVFLAVWQSAHANATRYNAVHAGRGLGVHGAELTQIKVDTFVVGSVLCALSFLY